jgi:tetratricopeptide (TPR) repeat protein
MRVRCSKSNNVDSCQQATILSAVEVAQMRLARYYLGVLRTADTAYRRGSGATRSDMLQFSRDWPQIAGWQAWLAAASSNSRPAAELCAAYAEAGADLLLAVQSWQERRNWLEMGVTAARSLGNAHALARCLYYLGWAIHKQMHLDEAERVAREALALVDDLRDTYLTGQITHLLGEIMLRRGAMDDAERLHVRSVALLEAAEAHSALAEVYFSLSEIPYIRGEFERARDYALRCHRLYLEHGLNQTSNNSLAWLGVVTVESDDLEEGERYVRQSIAMCRVMGAQSTLAHALYILSGLMNVQGRLAEACVLAEESMNITQRIGEDWLVPYILVFQARTHLLEGTSDLPQTYGRKAVSLARERGYRLTLLYTLVRQAEYELAAGEIILARNALQEGLQEAMRTQATNDMAYGVYIAAKLWWAGGDAGHVLEWIAILERTHGLEYAARQPLSAFAAEVRGILGERLYGAAVRRSYSLTLQQIAEEILRSLT